MEAGTLERLQTGTEGGCQLQAETEGAQQLSAWMKVGTLVLLHARTEEAWRLQATRSMTQLEVAKSDFRIQITELTGLGFFELGRRQLSGSWLERTEVGA